MNTKITKEKSDVYITFEKTPIESEKLVSLMVEKKFSHELFLEFIEKIEWEENRNINNPFNFYLNFYINGKKQKKVIEKSITADPEIDEKIKKNLYQIYLSYNHSSLISMHNSTAIEHILASTTLNNSTKNLILDFFIEKYRNNEDIRENSFIQRNILSTSARASFIYDNYQWFDKIVKSEKNKNGFSDNESDDSFLLHEINNMLYYLKQPIDDEADHSIPINRFGQKIETRPFEEIILNKMEYLFKYYIEKNNIPVENDKPFYFNLMKHLLFFESIEKYEKENKEKKQINKTLIAFLTRHEFFYEDLIKNNFYGLSSEKIKNFHLNFCFGEHTEKQYKKYSFLKKNKLLEKAQSYSIESETLFSFSQKMFWNYLKSLDASGKRKIQSVKDNDDTKKITALITGKKIQLNENEKINSEIEQIINLINFLNENKENFKNYDIHSVLVPSLIAFFEQNKIKQEILFSKIPFLKEHPPLFSELINYSVSRNENMLWDCSSSTSEKRKKNETTNIEKYKEIKNERLEYLISFLKTSSDKEKTSWFNDFFYTVNRICVEHSINKSEKFIEELELNKKTIYELEKPELAFVFSKENSVIKIAIELLILFREKEIVIPEEHKEQIKKICESVSMTKNSNSLATNSEYEKLVNKMLTNLMKEEKETPQKNKDDYLNSIKRKISLYEYEKQMENFRKLMEEKYESVEAVYLSMFTNQQKNEINKQKNNFRF